MCTGLNGGHKAISIAGLARFHTFILFVWFGLVHYHLNYGPLPSNLLGGMQTVRHTECKDERKRRADFDQHRVLRCM